MSSIDIAAFRPIKTGSEYDALISKTPCKATFLGTDNTYFSIEQIKKWAIKYKSQTTKVARKLKGKNLEDTTNNIFKFLHDHVQYKQDGFKQNLRSPSCSWQTRKKGIDCKSYSIFASTILLNLGISHFLRMVKQPSINTNEFTHIYVVIPKNQKTLSTTEYLVIDATVHINQEVPYIEKYDLKMLAKMPHYGLNGSHQQRVHPMAIGILNFQRALQALADSGIPTGIISKLRNYVRSEIEKGNDPKFRGTKNGLWVDNQFFNFTTGLGMTRPVATAISPVPTAGVTIPTFKPTITTSTGGITPVNTGAGLDPLSIASNFINFNRIFGNFSNIFANGFDISCWGASYNKTEAKKDIALDFPFIINQSGLGTKVSTETVNRFSILIDNYIGDAKHGTLKKFAACTRKGHQLRLDESLKFKKQVFEKLAQNPNITITPTGSVKGTGSIRFPGYVSDKTFNLWVYPYTTYSVQINNQQTGINDINGNGTQTPKGPKDPKSKKNNTLPVLLGLGTIATLFFIPVTKVK